MELLPHFAIRVYILQYTHTNLFLIFLNQPKIRLYLRISDWFGTKQTSIWFQINQKMVNTIWFRIDLIRLRKDFSVCSCRCLMLQRVYFIEILTQTPLRWSPWKILEWNGPFSLFEALAKQAKVMLWPLWTRDTTLCVYTYNFNDGGSNKMFQLPKNINDE